MANTVEEVDIIVCGGVCVVECVCVCVCVVCAICLWWCVCVCVCVCAVCVCMCVCVHACVRTWNLRNSKDREKKFEKEMVKYT
jgi:hypothetical protein